MGKNAKLKVCENLKYAKDDVIQNKKYGSLTVCKSQKYVNVKSGKKMPKIDTLDALDDEMTSILSTL